MSNDTVDDPRSDTLSEADSHFENIPDEDIPEYDGYVLSIERSRFYPSDRLADEEVGHELGSMVDARDIVSATGHTAELTVMNQGDQKFPGGELYDIKVLYGTGVKYEAHSVNETVSLPPIDIDGYEIITTEIGPPESPPLCVVQFKIRSSDGENVMLLPEKEGPSINGIDIKAPVFDRTSLRILKELQDIKQVLEGI